MSDTKLKPCPFCGGDAEITVALEAGTNAFKVACCNCLASSAVVFAVEESPEPRLIQFWNTRALNSKEGEGK